MGTSLDRLTEFEEGTREPTIRQAEGIADLFGVAVFDLYGETDVEIDDPLIDYRTRTLKPARLTAAGLRKVVRAEKHARFTKFLLNELRGNFVPSLPHLAGELSDDLAIKLRQNFDEWRAAASNKEPIGGSIETSFLTWLRIYIELRGAITSAHDAPASDYWGFFTDGGVDVPSIFVNRSIQSRKSQLFTFCHEMGHYIEDREGVSNPYSASNEIERRCNRFAAEFIAPSDEIEALVGNYRRHVRQDVDDLISCVSRDSLLSKQAAAIRLRELQIISSKSLSHWYKSNVNWYVFDKQDEKDNAPVVPNIHHAKALGEIGYLPVYLASIALERKIIDSFDIEVALGLSRNLQEKAFSLAKRRVEAVASDAA